MGGNSLAPLGGHRGAGVTDIPNYIDDQEVLHRRIHPLFVRPDGQPSSQAFRDPRMSVDRARYWEVNLTLREHANCGVAGLTASIARAIGQEVVSDAQLLNPAHALVLGAKPKSIARKLARASSWVMPCPG